MNNEKINTVVNQARRVAESVQTNPTDMALIQRESEKLESACKAMARGS